MPPVLLLGLFDVKELLGVDGYFMYVLWSVRAAKTRLIGVIWSRD